MYGFSLWCGNFSLFAYLYSLLIFFVLKISLSYLTFFYLFYIQILLPLLLSYAPNSHLSASPSTTPPRHSKKGRPPLDLSKTSSSPYIKARQDNLTRGASSQKPAKPQWQVLSSLLWVLQTDQAIHLSHKCRGLIPCRLILLAQSPCAPMSSDQLSLWDPLL